jgi:hypothetical protein
MILKKGLVVIVILLFIGVPLALNINAEIESNESTYTDFLDDGNLSGYVYDSNMEPIEGARVRVYFHETYEEDYTDSSGYYHVTNIPICWCMKNATASKEDYVTEWVYLSIGESTTYNFILESDDSDLVEFESEFCGLGKKNTVQLTQQDAEIYFVIGIGMYIEGGTWPVVDFISPIFLIRFGKTLGPHILGPKSGEQIDFIEGDKFIGHYPYLNPIGIGFVCGIWIDVER